MNERRLEDFIQDWHCDEPSHRFARDLGEFLLGFLDHLKEEGLARRTINIHARNCWCIGKFECDYGSPDRFSPDTMFSAPWALHVYWFEHKMSDSKYAVASYKATWRRLYKYFRELRNVTSK